MTAHEPTKFKLHHIGPIDEAEIEVRPLTILAGPSGTGKSYLTHALYGFYLMLSEQRFVEPLQGTDWFANHPILTDDHFKDLMNHGETTISIDARSYITLFKKYLDASAELYPSLLGDVFNLEPSMFAKTRFIVEHAHIKLQGVFSSPNMVMEKSEFNGCVFSFYSEMVGNALTAQINIRIKPDGSSPRQTGREAFAQFLDSKLFSIGTPEPLILTSDRASISMLYKELDQSKDSWVRGAKRIPTANGTDLNLADYTLPVQKNIDFARDLSKIQKQQGMFGKDCESKAFKYIERWFQSRFRFVNNELRLASTSDATENSFDIPFHVASSGSREITLLYYYLKHVADKNGILFIDEPEAHLDPFKQMLFARLIVNCVNSGLRVVINTHSDYFVKEISNLIKLHSDSVDREEFNKYFPEYVGQETLDYRMVSAYTCDNRQAELAEISALGIIMPSLDNAIVALNNVSDALDGILFDDDES